MHYALYKKVTAVFKKWDILGRKYAVTVSRIDGHLNNTVRAGRKEGVRAKR